MDARTITSGLSVSPQITADDLQAIADQGFRAIICNRPDGEGMDQPNFEEIETAAQALGLRRPICRSPPARCGTRMPRPSAPSDRAARPGAGLLPHRHALGDALVAGRGRPKPLPTSSPPRKAAGYDMNGVVRRIANGGKTPTDRGDASSTW
jgi:sulfide:quinone oxidoreductase